MNPKSTRSIIFLLNAFLAFSVSICVSQAVADEAGKEAIVIIQLNGVSELQEKNIRSRLQLTRAPMGSNAYYIQHLYNQSIQEIAEAIEPFGYYQPVIEGTLTPLNNAHWQAQYSILLGPAVYIKNIAINIIGDAEYDPEFQDLVKNFPLKQGDILLHQPYEQLKEHLWDLANTRGYFQAKFLRHTIELDLISHTATIQVVFASGPRYRFGKISLQQDVLDDEFVRRFIPFKEGDFYSADDLLKLQNNLSNVYFSSASIEPHPTTAPYPEVPLDVILVPSKSQSYTAGIGYGTDTGVRGTLGWEWRRVNRQGHRLSVFAQPAQYMSNADIQYIMPGKNPLLDQYTIAAGLLAEDPPDRDLKSSTEYTNFSYRSGDPTTAWRRTLGINFQHDRYQNADIYEDSTILLPTVAWEQVRGNGNFAQKPGHYLRLNIRGAAKNALSTTSFLQGQATGKYIYPFGEKERLILKTDLGATADEHNLTALPPSLRFYAGGDNSVRGYGYQSLGIKERTPDGETRILGGLYLVFVSAELEHKLSDKWSLAAFFDAGQASNSFTAPLSQGVGMGIRWQSPIGPVRLDLAQPLNDPTRHIPRIHFSFGPDL